MEATSKFTAAHRRVEEPAGFQPLPIDHEFVRRSASYLASKGYRPGEIRDALVEQFDLSFPAAHEMLLEAAA